VYSMVSSVGSMSFEEMIPRVSKLKTIVPNMNEWTICRSSDGVCR
jgi:hypothetical protein